MTTAAAAVPVLSEIEARDLTNRIRESTKNLCDLLYQAHEGKAYRALGYATWNEYVTAELNISRPRAYQLLSFVETRRALADAAGTPESTIVDIREAHTREIKPILPEVIEAVRESVATGIPPEQAVRVAVQAHRKPKEVPPAEEDPDDTTPDLVMELEAAHSEIRDLRAANESLSASDTGRELLSLNARYAQLNARVQGLVRERNEANDIVKRYGNLLGRIRKELGVETNAEIIEAIHDLKR